MTPRGIGGIAVIRLTGESAGDILQTIFAGKDMQPRGRINTGRISYGFIVEPASGQPVDEVLVARTGEHDYEINCHGGYAAVREVMRVLRECGAEEIPWEEALGRGNMLKGRDPVQREAYRRLLRAKSERAVRHILAQFEGALSREIARLFSRVESAHYRQAASTLDDMLRHAAFGVALSEPVRVVIAGLPNSGKSSLLNSLVGKERAIVAEEAGTTRDIVDAETLIRGVPFHLHDTAGLRGAAGDAEAEGVARARAAAAAADCLVVVLDMSREVTPAEADFLLRAAGGPHGAVACLNKCDLVEGNFRERLKASCERGTPPPRVQGLSERTLVRVVGACRRDSVPVCFTDCLTGEGIDDLRAAIYSACIPAEPPDEDSPLIFSREQEKLLRSLRPLLSGAMAGNDRAASRAKRTLADMLGGAER